MRWGILSLILLMLLVFEGTLAQIFIPDQGTAALLVPRFGLVILIFISLYIGRRSAFFLGLIYGLLQDVLYSDVIGVYAFTMAVIPYICALIYQYFQLNIFLIIITVFMAVFVHENLVFLVFHFFGLTENVFRWTEMLPTALLNAVFATLIYQPLNRFLENMEEEAKDDRSI